MWAWALALTVNFVAGVSDFKDLPQSWGADFFFFSSLSIVDVGNADAGTGEVGQEPFCINN